MLGYFIILRTCLLHAVLKGGRMTSQILFFYYPTDLNIKYLLKTYLIQPSCVLMILQCFSTYLNLRSIKTIFFVTYITDI